MQLYQLHVDDLPPELWQHVLEHLSNPDQRTCRLVSHAFYGLATNLAFSKLTVKFGDWDVWDIGSRNAHVDSRLLEEAARAEDESFKDLECIAGNEWLARTVKYLEVHAFQVYVESATVPRDAEFMGEHFSTVSSCPSVTPPAFRQTLCCYRFIETSAVVHLARRRPSPFSRLGHRPRYLLSVPSRSGPAVGRIADVFSCS